MFFEKNKIKNKNIKFSEKEILCNCIDNYIQIANKNNNTLDDYISIIAFIYILKEQYPKYSKYFDEYLNLFEEKNVLSEYEINTNNIAKKYFRQYANNFSKAKEIIDGFIPNCSSRYINFMIGIGLCGPPDNKEKRKLLAKAYSWNFYSFANQAIYYTTLSLKDNCKDIWLLELNADNYQKIGMYDVSIDYYKKALKISNQLYIYKKIINIYKKNHEQDKAIEFLKSAKNKNLFNRNLYNDLNNELKILLNEKIGIIKHNFLGYNSIEGFWGKPNYKQKEQQYINLKLRYKDVFEKHIKRIDEISVIMKKGITAESMALFISLIKTDIENFSKINNFYNELNLLGLTNEYYYSDNYQKGYLLPKNTIIYLEKNNYINEAIEICDIAIKNNITWDNTKSGIIGRKERLLKKIENK